MPFFLFVWDGEPSMALLSMNSLRSFAIPIALNPAARPTAGSLLDTRPRANTSPASMKCSTRRQFMP